MFLEAFKFHDTYGIPLTIQLDYAWARGLSISIPQFYLDALAAGWKQRKVLSTISEALVDMGKSEEYIKITIDYLKNSL